MLCYDSAYFSYRAYLSCRRSAARFSFHRSFRLGHSLRLRDRWRADRRGFTLIEMLVAMALTLIMMAAVSRVFGVLGRTANDSRATIEMSGRLRAARNMLQIDLASTTCPTLPWTRPEAGAGYFEYVEGIRSDDASLDDRDNVTGESLAIGEETLVGGPTSIAADQLAPIKEESLVNRSTLGDYDDILMFTVRSRGEPFVGRGRVFDPDWIDGTIESQVAEVIWFAVENPADGSLGEPGLRTIYRRVLLIAPTVNLPEIADNLEYYRKYDISARYESDDRIPNTLADLTKRENRFGHASRENAFPNLSAMFPHPIDVTVIHPTPNDTNGAAYPIRPLRPLGAPFNPRDPTDSSDPERLGEDVVLTNVLAWDVRAFDSGAPLFQDTTTSPVVAPGDPGYPRTPSNPPTGQPISFGAYVDLNYYVPNYTPATDEPTKIFAGRFDSATLSNVNTAFAQRWIESRFGRELKSQLNVPTYDTWSFHYEHDGINQDRDFDIDEGTDGFDNDDNNGVDDIGERETSPPYPAPLRGIQVSIRVYEPDSRAIREVTIRQHFVPE